MITKPTIAKVLNVLRRNYRDRSPPPDELPAIAELWEGTLSDLDDEAFERAVFAHIRDPERGKFWPLVADLVAQSDRSDVDRAPTPSEREAALHRGRAFFDVATRARSSGGRDGSPHRYIEHYARSKGLIPHDESMRATEFAGCIAGIDANGGWANFDPEAHGQRDQAFMRKSFAEAFASTALAPSEVAAIVERFLPPPPPAPQLREVKPDETKRIAETRQAWQDGRPDPEVTTTAPPPPKIAPAVSQAPSRPLPAPKPVVLFREFHVQHGWCTPDQLGQVIPESWTPPVKPRSMGGG